MDKEQTKYNNFIDVLKGIGAIFIIITHFPWTDAERVKFLFPFWIETAVPLFMIISGYVYAISYKKQGIHCLSEAYLPRNIVNKLIRYTFPFLVVYISELIYLSAVGNIIINRDNYLEWVFCFFRGGLGLGSYYYPLMIQFIFLYPIIYFIIKKYSHKGMIICFAINAIYELLQRAYAMDGNFYRLLVFRYIFIIAAGCYMASEAARMKFKTGFALCLIGIAFIVGVTYLGYSPIIIIHWSGTSFIGCLYMIPIIFLLIKKVKNCRFMPLEIIGKASYNIFLTQMVWYGFGSWYLEKYIHNRAALLGMNLLVCSGVGLIFYFIETPITKWIIKKIYALCDKP
ncbi:MAG: acyltransferase [Lachnospiraceae bacterium]|nr:acyltransferase [Lachnospiraceae bacterium]